MGPPVGVKEIYYIGRCQTAFGDGSHTGCPTDPAQEDIDLSATKPDLQPGHLEPRGWSAQVIFRIRWLLVSAT